MLGQIMFAEGAACSGPISLSLTSRAARICRCSGTIEAQKMFENGSSYDKWTHSKLKTELLKRGRKVAGRKRELVER